MFVQSATKRYEVIIHHSFKPVNNIVVDEKTFVVIDKNVYELYYELLFQRIPEKQLYILDDIEENKVLITALDIFENMTGIPANRKS